MYIEEYGEERLEYSLEIYKNLVGNYSGINLITNFAGGVKEFDKLEEPEALTLLKQELQRPSEKRPKLPPAIAKHYLFENDTILRQYGYESVGYRGTTEGFLKVIEQEGFTKKAGSQGKNAKQRGEGVYVAKDQIGTAREYADNSAKEFSDKPVVLEIYAQKKWMTGEHIPMDKYGWDAEKEQKIQKWDRLYDYVFGNIKDYPLKGHEYKFSPKASGNLRAIVVEINNKSTLNNKIDKI